jgi:ABC-2 type transport system permease protein
MRKTLRKYWHIYLIGWQSAVTYRAELYIWLFIEAIPLVVMLVLWVSVYQQGNTLTGYNLSQLLTYYLIGHLISAITEAHFELDVVDQINDGSVAQYFLKPVSFKKLMITGESSWKSFSFLFSQLPLLLAIIFLAQDWLIFPSPISSILVIIIVFFGFILDSLMSLLVIAGAFFIDEGRSLSHLKWMLTGIFSGMILPLSLYPQWLENLSRALPFQFKFAVPMEVYLGKISPIQSVQFILFEIFWIIILYFGVKLSWLVATKKFTAVGN